MNKRKMRKLWIIPALTVVAALTLVVCWKTDVMGKFVPEEPYVEGEPQLMNAGEKAVVVTNEGGNQKGSLGSGATPMKGVPTAGKDEPKGSEANPFVLLEIVPEHAQQQMVYLNTSDKEYPLDVMQIGIDVSTREGKNFIEFSDVTNFGLNNSPGEWFCRYQYDLYKYGKDDETIKKPLAEIGKLYSLEMEPDVLKEKGINVQEFDNFFNQGDRCQDVKSLNEKYPELFQKDDSGEEIRDIALKDNKNWLAERKKKGAIHYDVSFTSEDFKTYKDYRYYVNAPEIIRENPHLFQTDIKGNELSEEVREDTNNWKGEWKGTDSYDYTVQTKNVTKEDYEAYENKELTMQALIGKYSDAFRTDINGKEIEKSRLRADGWELKKSKGVTILNSGYLHYVGSGGQYAFDIEEKWMDGINNKALVLERQEDGEWEYLEHLPDNAKEADAYWQFQQNPYNQELYWSVPMVAQQGWGSSRKIVFLDDEDVYVFTYKKDIDRYEFSYESGETHTVYSFKYYGLKTNDILKRSLFNFQDEEECKNFNLRVIVMTPAEINAAVKGDTAETLDIIERADMFYFGSYSETTDNISQVFELYNKYLKRENEEEASPNRIKEFYDNDLDWASCYKILVRLCNNSQLPLLWTQQVGGMINHGVDDTENTHMYVTEDATANHVDAKGSLNNIVKLYILTLQFDMLARKGEGEINYKRTFYDDILGRLQTIGLNGEAMEKAQKDTAGTTGYYERTLVEAADCKGVPLMDDEKKTCYYLWNLWTFYPADIKLKDGREIAADKDTYVQYGYLESFFDANADPFRDNVPGNHSGSDGYDGKNVGVVHGESSNANTNHSTLLGSPNDGGAILNTTMNVAYQIMNKQTPKIEPLKVKLEKRKKDYQRLSNELILIDYDKKAKYDTTGEEPFYIKITISNGNNEDAILTSLNLMKEEEDDTKIEIVPQKAPKESTAQENVKLNKEKITDVNGKNPVDGYRIPANGSLTFYAPYRLSQYNQDYTRLQLETRARKFLIVKGRKESTLGKAVPHTVTIAERTLFNLE